MGTSFDKRLASCLVFSYRPAHKKNEPVNFSKLISSGYGDEWLQQRDDWEKKNSQPNGNILNFKKISSIY